MNDKERILCAICGAWTTPGDARTSEGTTVCRHCDLPPSTLDPDPDELEAEDAEGAEGGDE